GALVTALLFTIGKSLIGWYIGTSAIATSYGAAGALMVVLVWVYYSAQIFLFGAEITRSYSVRRGSRRDLAPVVAAGSAAATAIPRPVRGASGLEVAAWIVLSCLITVLMFQIGGKRE
ncbi:YhjD/YihY/BrkB family envelope integrity protein, partial [Mesorhizobium sp. M2E.F.Ca.ET.154.01.1.1]